MNLASEIAIYSSVGIGLLVTFFLLFLSFLMSGERGMVAQEKARERRMAEHRLNARLLRLNL
jgi:hypothetical protein